MPHPDGGSGEYLNPENTFNEAYNYIGEDGLELNLNSGNLIRISQWYTGGQTTRVIRFNSRYSSMGRVCEACWGYERSCTNNKTGELVLLIDQDIQENKKEIVIKEPSETHVLPKNDLSISNIENEPSENKFNTKVDRIDNAFDILVNEIEEDIKKLKSDGTTAFDENDYELASKIAEDAKIIINFKDDVKKLSEKWNNLCEKKLKPSAINYARNRHTNKLQKGLRTPQKDFRLPILEVLFEMGGSGNRKDIIKNVYEKMKDKLNRYDHQYLESSPETPRWYNTIQWCRLSLVKEGLLKSDSPYGIWEISEKGLDILKDKQDS